MANESNGSDGGKPGLPVSALFDLDRSLERMDGDAELLNEVIDIFLEDHVNALEQLRTAAAKRDAEGLQRAMHTVKGAVGNFVAKKACDLAQRAESHCKQGQLDAAIELAPAVEQEIRAVAEGLRRFRLSAAA